MAREVSVDFSNKGAAQLVTGLTQSSPFLNPSIQGFHKSMRTWFGEGRFGQVFAKTNLYVGAPSAFLWTVNHNNPDYQAYPDWAKRQAWFIPISLIPGIEDTYNEKVGRVKTKFILVPKNLI